MSTHAMVMTMVDGKIKGIYNHSDGYKEHLGKTLTEHYTKYDDVLQLISHGAASYIDNSIDVSIFYHSWRGEELSIQEADNLNDFLENYREEYNYLFDFELGKWICITHDDIWTVL